MALVKYVGSKALKIDRRYGSKCMWRGHGDVQVVEDDDLAATMAGNHPDVWALIKPEDEAPKIPDTMLTGTMPAAIDETIIEELSGEKVSLRLASRGALARYADEELGLAVADGHSREQLLDAIVNHYDYRDKLMEEQRARLAEQQNKQVEPDPADGTETPSEREGAGEAAAEAETAAEGEAETTDKAAPETSDETQEITSQDTGGLEDILGIQDK